MGNEMSFLIIMKVGEHKGTFIRHSYSKKKATTRNRT
jgi:hypothetical protein